MQLKSERKRLGGGERGVGVGRKRLLHLSFNLVLCYTVHCKLPCDSHEQVL